MTTQTETRRLTRRSDDRVVAGVASGLAAYLGVDPVLVRVGFVLAATLGGFGILAYAALWVLTPEGDPGAVVEPRRDTGFWVAIGLFVLAALAIADNLADRTLLWPLILIAAGVALWRKSETSESRMTTTTTSGPAAASEQPASQPVAAATATDPTTPMDAAPPASGDDPSWTPPPPPERATDFGSARPPKAPRDGSPLGGIVFAIALIVTGLGLALDQADVIEYPMVVALSTALSILAGGLLVGAWVGRARWLIFPALALTPFVLAFGVSDSLDLRIGDGFGERNYTPATVEGIEDEYSLGFGELRVDLTDLEIEPGESVETNVRLGAGQILVFVPDDATVIVEYQLSAGDVELFKGDADEHINQGSNLTSTVLSRGTSEGAPRITLDIDQTFGELNVVRR